MARLPRTEPSVETKCRVALRQLGEMWPDAVIAAHPRALTRLLEEKLLPRLAALLGCEAKDLWLDHNPALGLREQILKNGKHVRYIPDEHDVDYLEYRPQPPESERSHYIKTYVRGDHGQFSDTVLMKRERKRKKKAARKAKPRTSFSGSKLRGGKMKRRPKQKIPSRPFQRRPKP